MQTNFCVAVNLDPELIKHMHNVCLYCKSNKTKKHGKSRTGLQRLKCCGCGKTFTKKVRGPGKKQPQPGVKSTRGRPELYTEKKQNVTITITPTAIKGLDELFQTLGLSSRSELIEQIGREHFTITATKKNSC